MVCLAGREAELIFRPRNIGMGGSSQDYEQAHRLLHILVDEISRQYRVYWKLLLLRTQDTLSAPPVWCAVEGLAEELLEKGTLTGKEAREVINESLNLQRKRKGRAVLVKDRLPTASEKLKIEKLKWFQ